MRSRSYMLRFVLLLVCLTTMQGCELTDLTNSLPDGFVLGQESGKGVITVPSARSRISGMNGVSISSVQLGMKTLKVG